MKREPHGRVVAKIVYLPIGERCWRKAGNPSGMPNCFDVDITNLDNPV